MGRRLLIGVLFGVVVYVGIVLWSDYDALASAISRIPKWPIAAAMGMSLLNYVIRFLKWERYRKLLKIELTVGTSFLIYLSGFSMGVTPGKMGEVLKSWMIRKVAGVRIHQSAPIVVAERITDLLGYLILVAIGGIASHPEYAWVFWATLGVCVLVIAMIGSEWVAGRVTELVGRMPFIGHLKPKVEVAFVSTRVLLSFKQIIFPTVISVISWGCECVGFWLIADAFVPGGVSLHFATYAWALSALIGALAIFLPGGIGATEYSLGTLLRSRYQDFAGLSIEVARSYAAGALLLARGCTLWFSVLVGLIATAIFQRRYGRVSAEDAAD